MRRFLLLALLLTPAMALAGQVQLQFNRTDPKDETLGPLTFKGAVVIPPGPDKVGGLSSLEMGRGDRQLFVQADDGRFYEATLQWQNGRLTGAVFGKGRLLNDEDGKPPRSRARFDSESLARLPDGSWLVGYERDHRIERYDNVRGQPMGTPKPLPTPPGLLDITRNEGLESLAVLKDGRILAIAEAWRNGAHPAWLWQEGNWSQLTYEGRSGFQPTDATTLPNGDVLVLERGLNIFYGFRSRFVLLSKAELRAGAALKGRELAVLESPRLTENFEGIHAFARADGKVGVLIVSDNNFGQIQQTILAAFELTLP